MRPKPFWGQSQAVTQGGELLVVFVQSEAFNNEAQSGVTNALQYWGYVSSLRMYNRVLSNGELLTIWNATKGRFAL